MKTIYLLAAAGIIAAPAAAQVAGPPVDNENNDVEVGADVDLSTEVPPVDPLAADPDAGAHADHDARAKAQGPANANPRAVENANENSVLSTGTVDLSIVGVGDPVADPDGEVIGAVNDLVLDDRTGNAVGIEVLLTNGTTVEIPAAQLSLEDGVITTAMLVAE